MKKHSLTNACGRTMLSAIMIVQLGMAQSSIDVELQKKAKLLSPDLARQIALEKEELRAEAAELTVQAIKFCDGGKYREAYIALTEAINKDSRNAAAEARLFKVNAILYDTYAGYGMSRMAVSDYQGAIDNFRLALEHKPGGQEALDGIRKARGKLEESVSQNLGKIVSDDMTDEEQVDLLVKQARDLEVQSRYEEAKATYKEAIKIESEDPRPRRLLKELIDKQGRIVSDQRRIERRKVMEDLIKAFLQNPEEYVDVPDTDTSKKLSADQQRREDFIKKCSTTKIESINFNAANLQEVVSYISEMSGISIVLNTGDKPITDLSFAMANASVYQIVEHLKSTGLFVTYEENAIVMSRGEGAMETRFWIVSEVQQAAAGESAGGSPAAGGGDAGGLFDPEPTGDTAAPGEEGTQDPPVVKMVKDFLPNLADHGGAVFYESQSRTLTVRATPADLEKVDAFIKDLEAGSKQNQVEIQAKFVEMTDEDLHELSLGIKLKDKFKLFDMNDRQDRAALLNPIDLTGALRRYAKGARSSRYADRLNDLVALVGTRANQNQISDEVIGFFTSAITDPEVGLVFHAISQDTNADVLSAPTITSVSGQSRVRIRQITEVMYPEDYTVYKPAKIYRGGTAQMTAADLIDVQQGYATVQGFKTEEVGIELIVSPTIGEDGKTVDMEITTKVSRELEPRVVVAYTGDSTIYPALDSILLNIPRFKNSEVTTQVVVNDGETIVLGGMIVEMLREYHDKVPFWGDLPMVGRWFRSDGSYQVKKNLMIFVTVRVVTPSGESYADLTAREQRKAVELHKEQTDSGALADGDAASPEGGELESTEGGDTAPATDSTAPADDTGVEGAASAAPAEDEAAATL